MAGFVGISALYSFVVPGDFGALFPNPFSFAIFPSVFIALIATQNRLSNTPKAFGWNYSVVFLATWVVLILFLPLGSANIRLFPVDHFPLPTDRVVEAGDNRVLVLKTDNQPKAFSGQLLGPMVLAQPEEPLQMETGAVYDPANKRLIVQGAADLNFSLVGVSDESRYFEHRDFLRQLLVEFSSLFAEFAATLSQPWLFVVETGVLAFLLMGLFAFFSFKAFPLVKWVSLLLMGRVVLWVWAFAHQGARDILSGVLPEPFLGWFPEVFLMLIGGCLFWGILLAKPYKPLGSTHA